VARDLLQLKKRIGERLRARREDLGVSQEHVAFQAEISPTYLSQIENGQRNPSLETLFRVSVALKLDLSELVRT
jgi:transcriptional regulator with XRE-family HTH domain